MPGGLPADLAAAVERAGEMGARFAASDWTTHPLGPPSGWVPEMRAAVAVALASRFPTILWLGPELWIVYNDAYIPILSEKHPAALGGAGSEVWADVWDVVGPMLGGVVTTGVATWSDDLPLRMINEGRRRERYFTFTYSPMFAADGTVHGVFCAVTETTERVLGARRLQALNSLAGAVMDAQTAAETLHAAMAVCQGHATDLPFAAAYLRDPASGVAVLEAATPAVAALPAEEASTIPSWFTGAAIEPAGRLVEDLERHLPGLRAIEGDDAPEQALVLPMADGAVGGDLGWLVVGINRYHPLDDQYRAFCRLLADQVSAAVAKARAYEAERHRAEALAELDAAKTAFFTNVSHEFRTPLTLLLGPTEDLLADADDPLSDGQRHRVAMVARNAQRLLSLVNTLLDFSRLQAGTTRGRFRPTDLGAETARLAMMFGSAVTQAGLDFRIPEGTVDDAVLAISELVTNALTHGRPPLELRLRCTASDLVVEVSDEFPAPPRRLRPTADDEHGRGLVLIAALAARWGTRPVPDGKWVWCTFPLDPTALGRGS